ncbi:unnamed protein product, partial [Symbiodinium necroappetens]
SISLGPFTICDTGLSVAPKFEIGVEVAGCGARVGVGDVRDGISLFASASASFQVFGKGSNWKNMLQNLRTNAHHLPDISSSMKSLIDDAIHTTDKVVGPSGQETAEVVRLLNEEAPESAGITKSDLLKDHSSSSAMEVMMKASSGIGISAKVCPGWKDADGFHNLGGGASLDMGVELSFDLVVGYRPRPPGGGPRMVRLLLGLCNFFFQITFPIGCRNVVAAASAFLWSFFAPKSARADVGEGDSLPAGARQEDRIRKGLDAWKKLPEKLQTAEDKDKEWDDTIGFLRRIYGLNEDMKYLTRGFRGDKKTNAEALIEKFRKQVKASDKPVKAKDFDKVMEFHKEITGYLEEFQTYLLDATE